MKRSLVSLSMLSVFLFGAACTGPVGDADDGAAALSFDGVSRATFMPATAHRRAECAGSDNLIVDFEQATLTSSCASSGTAAPTATKKSLSAANAAKIKAALSGVQETTAPASCSSADVDSLVTFDANGTPRAYVDAAGACHNQRAATSASLAKVLDVMRSVFASSASANGGPSAPPSHAPPASPPPAAPGAGAATGTLDVSALTIIESLPPIDDPLVRFVAGPSSGQIAVTKMRGGDVHEDAKLVSSLPNLRFYQRYRAWDLRALGGQLLDYLYDPGLKQVFIRVTEGKRTAIWGPWPHVVTQQAQQRMNEAQFVLPLGPMMDPPELDWYDKAVEACLLNGKRIDEYMVTIGNRQLVVDNGPLHLLPNDPRVIVEP